MIYKSSIILQHKSTQMYIAFIGILNIVFFCQLIVSSLYSHRHYANILHNIYLLYISSLPK